MWKETWRATIQESKYFAIFFYKQVTQLLKTNNKYYNQQGNISSISPRKIVKKCFFSTICILVSVTAVFKSILINDFPKKFQSFNYTNNMSPIGGRLKSSNIQIIPT